MALEVPMDYHLLFLAMNFIVFIITIFLLFVDTTFEKAVGAFILNMFNMVLCIVCGFLFTAVDIYGYDSTGAIVHNVHSSMHMLSWIYVTLFWVNLMMLFYATYLFYKKPWTDVYGKDEIQYQSPPY